MNQTAAVIVMTSGIWPCYGGKICLFLFCVQSINKLCISHLEMDQLALTLLTQVSVVIVYMNVTLLTTICHCDCFTAISDTCETSSNRP